MTDRGRHGTDPDGDAERFHREQRAKASLADGYLEQALMALRDAASADALWRRELPLRYGQDSLLGPIQRRLTAVNERLAFLRTAVLFSALAVEATANQFLAIVLSPTDVNTIDRLPTLDKLVIGPRLAGADTPFKRGHEPMQTLKRLGNARNSLVHARPGKAATLAHLVLTEDDLSTFGPQAAVDYIKAAAHTGVLLGDLLYYRLTFAAVARNIWTWRSVLDEHAKRFPDDLRTLPDPDEPPVRDLLVQMEARAVGRARRDESTGDDRRSYGGRPRGALLPYEQANQT